MNDALYQPKTLQNLYANRALHAQVGHKSEMKMWRELYDFAPAEEVRHKLLDVLLSQFDYTQQEWPTPHGSIRERISKQRTRMCAAKRRG